MQLVQAQTIALSVLNGLKTSCKRACIAGSIRRRKAEVKDIEIVCITRNYRELFNSLQPFGRFIKPGTSEIIEWQPREGARYVRMLLHEGVKLDLFVAERDNWGSILMLRTGTAADEQGNVYAGFGPGMLSRWKQVSKGGRMEQGRFVKPNGIVVPTYEEKDVFDLLRVEYVEPQYRMSRRQIRVLT